jgi:hypothetical protein
MVLGAGPSDAVETRIVGLSRNSPACIELEVYRKHDDAPVLVDGFFESIKAVADDAVAPRQFGRPVFNALKEFVSVIGHGVRASTLTVGDHVIEVEHQARQNIERVFEPDYTASGSLDGMLEAVNIHGKRNLCALYPVVGPHRVNCYFNDGLFGEIQTALGKYVLMNGELRYRWREKFPYEATIETFEAVNEADQPRVDEIIGLAPEATNGLSSEEFVSQIRGAWN